MKHSPIIIALDRTLYMKNLRVTQCMSDLVWGFKVNHLFSQSDFGKLRNHGKIFVDYKLYDIPETMLKVINKLKYVEMVSVHCSNGKTPLKYLKENTETELVGITKLTSMDTPDCWSVYGRGMEHQVEEMICIAMDSGLDSITCSGSQLELVDKYDPGCTLKRIVPGIRLEDDDSSHVDTITPKEALDKGADYLIIGRPIIYSKDPERELNKILESL